MHSRYTVCTFSNTRTINTYTNKTVHTRAHTHTPAHCTQQRKVFEYNTLILSTKDFEYDVHWKLVHPYQKKTCSRTHSISTAPSFFSDLLRNRLYEFLHFYLLLLSSKVYIYDNVTDFGDYHYKNNDRAKFIHKTVSIFSNLQSTK